MFFLGGRLYSRRKTKVFWYPVSVAMDLIQNDTDAYYKTLAKEQELRRKVATARLVYLCSAYGLRNLSHILQKLNKLRLYLAEVIDYRPLTF